MKRNVTLDTSDLTKAVSITVFQFGTMPAPTKSYELLTNSVKVGIKNTDVFCFEEDIETPNDKLVRYNLRFQVDIHNSVNLQLCLSNKPTLWRWTAPIGILGVWSNEEQQAPWHDGNIDYCINISPSDSGITVKLTEHPETSGCLCAIIPVSTKVMHTSV